LVPVLDHTHVPCVVAVHYTHRPVQLLGMSKQEDMVDSLVERHMVCFLGTALKAVDMEQQQGMPLPAPLSWHDFLSVQF
jgi:hypothetical protein